MFIHSAFSMDSSVGISFAKSKCKLYCASEERCWGCIKVCNSTCQWKAVTECERKNATKISLNQSSSQKPGKIILNFRNKLFTSKKFSINFFQPKFINTCCDFNSLFGHSTEYCWSY